MPGGGETAPGGDRKTAEGGLTWNYGLLVSVIVGGSVVLAALWKIGRIINAIVQPVREFLSEHDILWEDYNLRTGGAYRRRTGRGAPPDPEDFYRDHPERLRADGV